LKLIYTIFFSLLLLSCYHHADQEPVVVDVNPINDTINQLIEKSKKSFFRDSNEPLLDNELKKALALAKQYNLKNQIGEIYLLVGKRHREITDYNKAIWYFNQTISIAEKNNYDGLHAWALHELAVVFRRMGDNAQSLILYTETLEWAESVQDTFLIHCAYNGIGNVYFRYAKYDEAISNFRNSLRYTGVVHPNILGKAINTNTLGESWLFLGNIDSAMYYLNLSLQINEELDSDVGRLICRNGLAMAYNKQGDYQRAIRELNVALSKDLTRINKTYVCMSQITLGRAYLYNKLAEQVLIDAYHLSLLTKSKDYSLDAVNALSELYEEKGLLNKALEYNRFAMAYKDTITDELLKHNSEAMNVLYKAERQEREILALKQKTNQAELKVARQKNWFLFVGSVLFTGLLLSVFAFWQRRLRNKYLTVKLEQRLLRSQLDPHFVFNSLTAVQNFIIRNDKMVAFDYLANFSRLMRNILVGSRTENIAIETEVEIISDYLKLQQLRFDHKFDFEVTVSEDIDQLYEIPPMLIQPFVENAVEHGIRDINYRGFVKVSINQDQGFLILTIDDNGVGLSNISKQLDDHVSLATQITRERLANMQRILKKRCSLLVENKYDKLGEPGVLVTIQFPAE